MRIVLRNDFHNSEATVIVPGIPCTLTSQQTARASRTLCGNSDCHCGKVRGPQYHQGNLLRVQWALRAPLATRYYVTYRYPEEVQASD